MLVIWHTETSYSILKTKLTILARSRITNIDSLIQYFLMLSNKFVSMIDTGTKVNNKRLLSLLNDRIKIVIPIIKANNILRYADW